MAQHLMRERETIPRSMNIATTAPFPFNAADDDLSLVARFQRGDQSAFAQIVRAHRDRIYGYVRGMLRDETDAEEVTQDTFVRAYRALDRFRGDASLTTWLHRIATNLARNRYWYFFRRHRQDTISLDWVAPGTNDSPLGESFICEDPDPCQQSTKAEFLSAVRESMAEIDPLFREPLEMRAGKGMSYQEIAAPTGVPTGTVKSRISRARRHLRSPLASRLPDITDNATYHEVFTADRR